MDTDTERYLDDELKGIKPESAEDIGVAQLRARLGEQLFGVVAEPVRLGRLVMLEELGQGGMGVVYKAYDPDLDRKVAVKLLHTDHNQVSDAARERFQREAQALARLSHPNVVPVYDVGVLDTRVFIVMEFVIGQTLREWLDAEPRTWQQILDVYMQAGRGLAAAHDAKLIHRDFKPENALVGDDGRVRVLDFGLARGQPERNEAPPSGDRSTADDGVGHGISIDALADTAGPEPDSAAGHGQSPPRPHEDGPGDRLQQSLTVPGAMLGTPAYMSPEQFSGVGVGTATDQFSFCVSLFEALHGQRPYAGETLGELRASLLSGEIVDVASGKDVPAWLHPVVERGLATDAENRHESMGALLAELDRNPARGGRKYVALAGALSLVLALYLSTRGQSPEVPVCQGAKDEIANVWNDERRASVKSVLFATQRAYAEIVWPQVERGLDDYAEIWAATHTSACQAHVRGEQSDEFLDRRMTCLHGRRQALKNAVKVLEERDRGTLINAPKVVRGLPRIETCSNPTALLAEVPPPEDPDIAREVSALRDRLTRAHALENAGRYQDGLDVAREITSRAETFDYQPLVAESLLTLGRILVMMGKRHAAVAPLDRAAMLGVGAHMDTVAVEALARRIYAEGTLSTSTSDPLPYLAFAEALTQRIAEPGFVHALLLNNIGTVFLSRGERDKARAYLERALKLKESETGAHRVELINVLANVALVTEDEEHRLDLLRRSRRESEAALGPAHPEALTKRLAIGVHTRDPAAASALLAPTCELCQRYHPEILELLLECLENVAFLHMEQGNTKAATMALSSAAERLVASRDEAFHAQQFGHLLPLFRGYERFLEGRPDEALVAMNDARTILLKMDGLENWWMRQRVAQIDLATGLAHRQQNELDAALIELERSLQTFNGLVEETDMLYHQRWRAWAQMELATALWDMHRHGQTDHAKAARARADDLMGAAEAWYGDSGSGYQWRIEQLARWRSQGL